VVSVEQAVAARAELGLTDAEVTALRAARTV